MRIVTLEVLADCYLGPNKRSGRMLSHAVQLDNVDRPLKALCGRVSPLSFADAGAGDPTSQPTCERCQRALRNLKPRTPGDQP